MSQFDDLLSQVPVDQLAQQFGVDQTEMNEAVQAAIPALVGGMEANAADPAGAQSLLNALGDHAGGFDLSTVDQGDGMKIVGNIFGDNTDQVMSRLGGLGGSGGSLGPLVKKLLPVLAPLVLSWLAGKMSGGKAAPSGGGGGGIGDILGNIFGGGGDEAAAPQGGTATGDGPLFPGGQGAQSAPQQAPAGVPQGAPAEQPQASNPLQDILGQVLGGSGGGGGLGGGLGDILGGMLGGGRR